MRLFLASYRFGAHRRRFLELTGPPGRVAVVANACDAWNPAARASAVTSDIAPLRKLGFAPHEVDLRTDPATALADYPVVWVRGGNTFVLRAQLARSGADQILRELLSADALLYAGYSAGACVLTPSLRGLDLLDDPAEAGSEPRWDGLGLVDRAIVPHWRSTTDPAGDADRLVKRYRDEGVRHWALTDDEVVVVDGESVAVLR